MTKKDQASDPKLTEKGQARAARKAAYEQAKEQRKMGGSKPNAKVAEATLKE